LASTSLKQRIGIWVITIVMTVGTIFSFLVIIISNQNSAEESKVQQEKYNKYLTASNEYQSKVAAQTKELSDKYYEKIKAYSTYPAAFSKDSVTSLTTKDLVIGDGNEIKADTSYSSYYIGWNPDGKIFDQSIDTSANTLKAPLASGNLISGWNEGVIGMKVGGVRELTIPSDKAYGESGQGALIPANTPLKFIVMIIPTPEVITAPNYTEYLK